MSEPATKLANPTSVRALICGDTPTEELTAAMLPRLPSGGMAKHRMRHQYSLTGATWRLLDTRILAGAVELLDLDVATPFVTWLARYQRLSTAAQTTLTDPEQSERMVTLLPPRPLTITHGLGVTVCVNERELTTITFRLELTVEAGETSAVVRRGEICEVVCDVLVVTGSLALVGWSTPLWQPEPVGLPDVHLVVRPPVVIPLITGPRLGEPTTAGL